MQWEEYGSRNGQTLNWTISEFIRHGCSAEIDDAVTLIFHRAYQSPEAGHHPKRVFLLLILHVFLCYIFFPGDPSNLITLRLSFRKAGIAKRG